MELKYTHAITAVVGPHAIATWTVVCASEGPIDADAVRMILDREFQSIRTGALSKPIMDRLGKTIIESIKAELGYQAVLVPSDVTFRIAQTVIRHADSAGGTDNRPFPAEGSYGTPDDGTSDSTVS